MNNQEEVYEEYWETEKRCLELHTHCLELIDVLEWLVRKGVVTGEFATATIEDAVKRFKESEVA